MKYRFISAHRGTFKVGRMCTLLNVSRSGYYAWLKRPESPRSRENRALETKIRALHAASHGIYGSPKIHLDLIDDGVRCGKNRVARIMRKAGIRSRRTKKFKATTNSRHNLPVAANLLDQDFTAETPDSAWVGDITYVPTQQGWLYLAVLIDLYNRKVVGWSTSSRMTRQLAIDALQMALDRHRPAKGLIHHTDRGSQYASGDYQKVLADRKIVCSMSRKGNCYDNAVAESFFGLLKTEWVNHYRYRSRCEANQSLFYYIEIFYNRKRRHSALGYQTPHEYRNLQLAA
jgi:transposase InsO family protein